MPRSGYVLVVDDEADIVDLIVDLLQEEGYAVRGARTADTALEEIAAQPPAVIMLDLLMPHPAGRSLWDHLRQEQFADIPVILMTASPRAAEAMLEKGVVDYLAKPFDLEQLLACIANHVYRGNAHDATMPLSFSS